MDFVNENWGNPLRRPGEDGNYHLELDVPQALKGLHWNDFRYLCRVMTFSSLLPSVRGQSVSFPCLNGYVSIYRSRLSLSSNAGMDSFVQNSSLPAADRDRITRAWNWLRANNPLWADSWPIPILPEQLGQAVVDVGTGQAAHPGQQDFPGVYCASLDPGPRAGDVQMENLVVGVNIEDDTAVTFKSPVLMLNLFPDLFPFGHGDFKLEHYKSNLRPIPVEAGQEGNLPEEPPVVPAEDVADEILQFEPFHWEPEENAAAVLGSDQSDEVSEDLEGAAANDFEDVEVEDAEGAAADDFEDVEVENAEEGDGHEEEEERPGKAQQFSIKVYAKYFASNTRFICFMEDWAIKNTVYGYRMRSSYPSRQGQATTAGDLRRGKEQKFVSSIGLLYEKKK